MLKNNWFSKLFAFVAHIFIKKIKMVIKVKKYYAEELEVFFQLANINYTRKDDEGDFKFYEVEPITDEQIEFLELIPAELYAN